MGKLKRELELFKLTVIGIGIIVGVGIYVLIGKGAEIAGNALWISFLIASLPAIFTGLSYAELSSIFPKSGAEYVYISKAFNNKIARIVGWLIIFSGILGASTVASGFGNVFSSFVYDMFSISISSNVVAIILILFCGAILLLGVRESAILTTIATLISILGLLIIIFSSIPNFKSFNIFEARSISGIFEASALIFFAFIGFETIPRLSEESKNPKKDIPKAIILSILISALLYSLVAFSAISVVGWERLANSQNPLGEVAFYNLGNIGMTLLSLFALFATFTTAFVILLGTSRIIYGISEYDALPKVFISISKKSHVPWVSVIFVTLASSLFSFFGEIAFNAYLTDFTIFLTFILINLSVIKLRFVKRYSKIKNVFRTPLNVKGFPLISFLGILSCLFLIINTSLEILIYGTGIILIGLFIYNFTKKT
jgi:APA family basic amino acid/polyamine antiporter